VISFAEQFGNRGAQRELGILESNVRYWRKQKELLKNAETDRAFRGPKAGKSAYLTHPDFSTAKLGKKSAQITRVNTLYRPDDDPDKGRNIVDKAKYIYT
jgi:hypothetical protein